MSAGLMRKPDAAQNVAGKGEISAAGGKGLPDRKEEREKGGQKQGAHGTSGGRRS